MSAASTPQPDEYRAFADRHYKLEMLSACSWALTHMHVALMVHSFVPLHTLEVSDIGDNAFAARSWSLVAACSATSLLCSYYRDR